MADCLIDFQTDLLRETGFVLLHCNFCSIREHRTEFAQTVNSPPTTHVWATRHYGREKPRRVRPRGRAVKIADLLKAKWLRVRSPWLTAYSSHLRQPRKGYSLAVGHQRTKWGAELVKEGIGWHRYRPVLNPFLISIPLIPLVRIFFKRRYPSCPGSTLYTSWSHIKRVWQSGNRSEVGVQVVDRGELDPFLAFGSKKTFREEEFASWLCCLIV